MQERYNEWVQQATDFLGPCLDGYAPTLTVTDQLVEEDPISCQVLLQSFGRQPAKKQIIIMTREKLQERNRSHEAKSLLQNRKQAGAGGRSWQGNSTKKVLTETFVRLFKQI